MFLILLLQHLALLVRCGNLDRRTCAEFYVAHDCVEGEQTKNISDGESTGEVVSVTNLYSWKVTDPAFVAVYLESQN